MNRVSEIGHSIFILTCYYSVIYVFGIPFVYSLVKKKHKTMKKKVISLFMVIALSMTAGAQTQIKEHRRSITLDEAIVIARTQSVDAAVALNELKTAYWEYRTFRANLLPEMNLKATLPSYNKKYNSYQQEDGTYTYVRNNNLQMSGELSIDQSIWFTGGTLSLNSSLDFLKQLDGDKSKRYMSVPIALTLNQPIFGVNNIKWDRRIEPVRYAEAKASFLSATENVTRTTINYFFNLLLAKENVNIARQNLENAQKLHEVAKAKRSMGQISENDLLQLELNVLDARSTLTDNESTLKSRMFQLRSFLALSEDEDLEPVDKDRPQYSTAIFEAVEIELKYEGYIKRQLQQVAEFKRVEGHKLPPDLDYNAIQGLRLEAREKLSAVRPMDLGQASRISGVSPADLTALMIWLENKR